MLRLSGVALFLSLASTALTSSFLPVTGALRAVGLVDGTTSGGDAVPLRRSITELAAEAGPQWDLYIQALRSMYDKDPADRESFFQVAGIHGRPFIEYDNAGPMNTNGWGGYSTHGENLFIIWHRPFLAFFEQMLVQEAKKIASSYPAEHRSIYEAAADHLRAPFWDWALEPWLPSVVLPETIEVNVAGNGGIVKKTIDNPLYTFRFPKDVLQGKFGYFNTGDRMYRCANKNAANENLYSRNYKGLVYDTFMRSKTFSQFATTATSGGSLEGIHNSVHWDAGCGGQFMNSEYSAFEPLFMLHHSNVDRLWAYWQAIYPDHSTFNGVYQGFARFETLAGTLISVDTPLQPFRQTDGSWHTPMTVNSIKAFAYSYEGLEYWTKSESEMKEGCAKIINDLYSPNKPQATSKPAPKPTSTKITAPSSSSKASAAPSSTGAVSSASSSTESKAASSPVSSSTGSKSTSCSTDGTASASSASTSAAEPSMVAVSSASSGNLVPGWNNTSASQTATQVGLPVVSTGIAQQPQANTTDTGSSKSYFVGIDVEVSQLPFRPCSIEVSIDIWRAGSMVIMKMPLTGVLHDSIPLADAIAAAGLDMFPDSELVNQISSRLHVILRKPDDSIIDLTGTLGLKVHVDEVDMTQPAGESDFPQVSQPQAHPVIEPPVPKCGVMY